MAIGAEINGKLIHREPDAPAVADDGASGGDDSEPDPAPFLGRQPS